MRWKVTLSTANSSCYTNKQNGSLPSIFLCTHWWELFCSQPFSVGFHSSCLSEVLAQPNTSSWDNWHAWSFIDFFTLKNGLNNDCMMQINKSRTKLYMLRDILSWNRNGGLRKGENEGSMWGRCDAKSRPARGNSQKTVNEKTRHKYQLLQIEPTHQICV